METLVPPKVPYHTHKTIGTITSHRTPWGKKERHYHAAYASHNPIACHMVIITVSDESNLQLRILINNKESVGEA
jgi:hypothetical protein